MPKLEDDSHHYIMYIYHGLVALVDLYVKT